MSKRVLITGASSGFGKLTTKTLLASGYKVAASMRQPNGRNKANADELKQLGAHIVELDVTDESSVQSGVDAAVSALGGLDVVINNAGLGVSGMQEHFTAADFQKLFDINVFGVQRVNRAVLPTLRGQGSGLIIYVSSLLGRISLPFYGPYNASKWALEALAENYRVELSAFGIQNAIVEPGGFPTAFMESLVTPSDNSRAEAYGDFMQAPQQMGEAFGKALAANPEQNPQIVADAIKQVIETPAEKRPFRTVVDKMGMGQPLEPYNQSLEEILRAIYGNFGIANMLG